MHQVSKPNQQLQGCSERQVLMRISIWKPLRGPVTDWPLAFCNAPSVDTENDLIAMDLVSRKSYTENYQVYHNKKLEWCFYNNQTEDEVIIFRQSDTVPGLSGLSGQFFPLQKEQYKGP